MAATRDCCTNLREENIKLKEMLENVKVWLRNNPLDWLLDASGDCGQAVKGEFLAETDEPGELPDVSDPFQPDQTLDEFDAPKKAATVIQFVSAEKWGEVRPSLESHTALDEEVNLNTICYTDEGHGKTTVGEPNQDGSNLSRTPTSSSEKTKSQCIKCENIAVTLSNLKNQKDANLQGIRYPCDECDLATSNNRVLKKRRKGIQHHCDECDFVASQAGHLKYHKESKHEGIRYSCDECEYGATTAGHLRRHKESMHDGIRYFCDYCDFAATTAGYLKVHKERKHEGTLYPCDHCEYTATLKSDLKRHKKKKHNETPN